jgi:hypothetical protein
MNYKNGMTKNRIKPAYWALVALSLFSAHDLARAADQQPVYVYLFARVSDHVNVDMTEDRLRHVLPEVDRYRQLHPEAHASAVILFSGAVSKALEARNGRTHIVDFVKDYVRRGVIEVGYDGTDEPTYDNRPLLQINLQQSPEERWKLRQTISDQFLTEARDPLTGAPASGTGGLKATQEVFGAVASLKGLEPAVEAYRPAKKARPAPGGLGAPVAGVSFKPALGIFREVGGDTEALQMLRKYNAGSLVMFGIPAVNPFEMPGYGTMIANFGERMSPAPETAPELYWQDYVLRVSEAAPPVRGVVALYGIDPMKGVLDKAKRSTVNVVQVELGGLDNYLQPEFAKNAPNAPLDYAYDHPQSPKLPADALRPSAETNAGWAKEDALLKWLTEDYFRNNSGSRFVSSGDLSKIAAPSTGFSVSTASLRSELAKVMQKVGRDTYLFDYLRVDGEYLSMAELFQVLTDELAEFHRTGTLPQSVKAVKVYGPFRLVTGHGPNTGEVTAGDLERICAEVAPALHDTTGTGVPKNSVPPLVKINGLDLNPAQLIRLMVLALDNPAPETKLPVRMSYMLGEAAHGLPRTRLLFDCGFLWTLKPARLALN